MQPGKLDVDTHATTIIERVLNLGTLTDWRWLVVTYGVPRLRDVIMRQADGERSSLRPETSRVAELMFA